MAMDDRWLTEALVPNVIEAFDHAAHSELAGANDTVTRLDAQIVDEEPHEQAERNVIRQQV